MTRRLLVPLLLALGACAGSDPAVGPPYADDPSLEVTDIRATYAPSADAIVFELVVAGDVATTIPEPAGQLDGAPVLGYVFPTTLSPTDVGFADVDGTVALAVTSHPDFDDTPLWDEGGTGRYDDDGAIYHTHWVVLGPDERAPAGLAVLASERAEDLPPTAPMPIYLDSPGFTVVEDGQTLRVIVPADRVRRNLDFEVGGLTAWMQVSTSGGPMLAVHAVLSSVDGGAPTRRVGGAATAPASAWPVEQNTADTLAVAGATVTYVESLETYVFSVEVEGTPATLVPEPAGSVHGAPVIGYVFPTTIPPAAVGFVDTDGLLVLAVTSHPDFDDTPLWDENLDGDYVNDGATYHVHWAVLVEDAASPAGLSVPPQADAAKLPPTAPMPMYLDSPGFHAFVSGQSLHVLVPAWHLRGVDGFTFDALTASMRVDTSGPGPVLRVEEVHAVVGGALTIDHVPTTTATFDGIGQ